MWYLQGDTLLMIAGFSLLTGLLRRWCPHAVLSKILPVPELLILFTISKRLCLFYMAYIAMGIVCAELLHKYRKAPLFLLFSLGALCPFFLSRGASFGISLPFLFVSTGIAFNMLKLIDVYYFVYYAETKIDPLVFIHYMLFLPVFTSGPIFRYRDFQKTYRDPLPLTGAEFTDGFKRVLRGLFKKVVLAAWLQTLLAWLLTSSGHWYISCLAVLCSYGILYFDLSGYSDIAIAFSRMAGFDAPENFKKPWAAPSFTQFWRSWHATLSDWIREHIFVVVRGKKLSRYFTAALAFTAMLVMGLWHGFQIPYLIAGCYNGLLLAGENILSLTTVNRRKVKRSTFILRCAAINFLFGLNTLVFTMPSEKVLFVLRSFLRL